MPQMSAPEVVVAEVAVSATCSDERADSTFVVGKQPQWPLPLCLSTASLTQTVDCGGDVGWLYGGWWEYAMDGDGVEVMGFWRMVFLVPHQNAVY